MKYKDLSPKVRSMINLLTVAVIGAVLSIVFTHWLVPNDATANRFLAPFMPILIGGTALTLFSTFTFGVVNLGVESESKSRRTVLVVMALTLVVAYLFIFFNMGPGGLD